jgi:hypothetical protein
MTSEFSKILNISHAGSATIAEYMHNAINPAINFPIRSARSSCSSEITGFDLGTPLPNGGGRGHL